MFHFTSSMKLIAILSPHSMGVVVVQLPSCAQLFATPWTAACQASLSLTISRSLPKFTVAASFSRSGKLTLCQALGPHEVYFNILNKATVVVLLNVFCVMTNIYLCFRVICILSVFLMYMARGNIEFLPKHFVIQNGNNLSYYVFFFLPILKSQN